MGLKARKQNANGARTTDRSRTDRKELEELLEDEERQVAAESGVPDDVKEEILLDIERRREADLEEERADGP